MCLVVSGSDPGVLDQIIIVFASLHDGLIAFIRMPGIYFLRHLTENDDVFRVHDFGVCRRCQVILRLEGTDIIRADRALLQKILLLLLFQLVIWIEVMTHLWINQVRTSEVLVFFIADYFAYALWILFFGVEHGLLFQLLLFAADASFDNLR